MMRNETTSNVDFTNEIEYFKLRYGCYFKVIDVVSTESITLLSKKDNFNLFLAVFCIAFAILNIGSNLLLAHALIKTNRKLNFVQRLFVYLSFIDLVAGVVLMPAMTYYLLFGLHCLRMTLMFCVIAYVAVADATVVLVISVLRLQAIQNPFKHIGLNKKCGMLIGHILVSMMGPPAFYIIYYIKGSIQDFQVIGYLTNGMMSSLTLVILSIVGFTLYEIRKRKRKDLLQVSMLKNHKKSAGSLLIIGCLMLFFIVVQVPNYYILHTLLKGAGVLSGETFRTTKRVADLTVILNLLNTSMNSIVILCRSKKMKRYYQKRFQEKFNLSFSSESESSSSAT